MVSMNLKLAAKKTASEREDPEVIRKRALNVTVTQYLAMKRESEAITERMKEARAKIAELAAVNEVTPKCELVGLATVTWVTKSGSRKIDRELLVKVLMEKAGASGEQANKIADMATVTGEGSSYVEVRAAK